MGWIDRSWKAHLGRSLGSNKTGWQHYFVRSWSCSWAHFATAAVAGLTLNSDTRHLHFRTDSGSEISCLMQFNFAAAAAVKRYFGT